MSLYRRGDSPNWWIKLSVNGRALQRSTGTSDRRKAREYHDKLKARLWDAERLGVRPGHTWEEAVVRWDSEKSDKATIAEDRRFFRWAHPHLAGKLLSEIDRDLLDRLIDLRRSEGVNPATINREMAILRAVLRRARDEWEWLDRVPKFRMLKQSKLRVRFLTEDEARRLLAELPPHLERMAWFTLLTGLRRRNVLDLRWAQLNLTESKAWVQADEAKAGEAIPVPLSLAAVELLWSIQSEAPEGFTYVFTYHGKRIRQVSTKAWRAALKRAGIENFRWHDLRHTWASWHLQRGTPVSVLQELGGWKSVEMVRRYAHLSQEHLAQHAERYAGQIGFRPQNLSYDPATSEEVAH